MRFFTLPCAVWSFEIASETPEVGGSSLFQPLMNIDKAMQQSDLPNMNSRICIDPAVCHGKPVIRGSRVLVSTLLGALAGGDSVETILADYPNISREDIAAALEFASDLSDYQVSAYDAVA